MTIDVRVPVLIVGAGPTGLAAALFLSHRGVAVRIIDSAQTPTETSKALLVNPRTLELLHDSGVAARIMTEGSRITHTCMHHRDRLVVELSMLDLLPGHPLIGMAQARTEALLHEALTTQGVDVERGVTLQTLQQNDERVTSTLKHKDGSIETAHASLVFGADGARSVVRHQLAVAFEGSAFPEPWRLWDVQLQTSLDPQSVHLALLPDGFMFLMALQGNLWRVLGNSTDPLAQLPAGSVPGEIAWQSDFHIAHRVASRACVGRVALGGDAAHIHSPLGARGMNLGIEDAWVFADCAADALNGRLERMREYGHMRESIHRRVVKKIEAMSRVMRGKPWPVAVARDLLVPQLAKIPSVKRQVAQTVAGLDHPLRTHL